MAFNPKVLGQSRPLAATLTAAYTVPAVTKTTVSSIAIHNTSGTTDPVLVTVAPAGAADATVHQLLNVNIPGDGTVILTVGITLATTDVVRVRSENGTSNFHLYGIEEA
jgi:hypothetical protein